MQLTHLLDGVHALDHLAEDDVLAVEPRRGGGAEEGAATTERASLHAAQTRM